MPRQLICFLAISILTAGAAMAQTVDCAHATMLKWASEHGFRAQTSEANELYCRSVVIVGSRIPHTECGTEVELATYVFSQMVDNNVAEWNCGESRP